MTQVTSLMCFYGFRVSGSEVRQSLRRFDSYPLSDGDWPTDRCSHAFYFIHKYTLYIVLKHFFSKNSDFYISQVGRPKQMRYFRKKIHVKQRQSWTCFSSSSSSSLLLLNLWLVFAIIQCIIYCLYQSVLTVKLLCNNATLNLNEMNH